MTALLTIGVFLFLFLFIGYEGMPVFSLTGGYTFLFTTAWNPTAARPELGIGTMLAGSLYVSFLAVLMALLFGVGCAVYIIFCAPRRWREMLLSFLDLIAGVPSVIFGFIGLTTAVRFMERSLSMSTGECVLAAAVVLAVMILPFIVANCAESVCSGRERYEEASLALGVNKWHMIMHLLPHHLREALTVSLILSFARAMGETMAVMMVMGNAAIMPTLLGKGESVPALIALEMGSAEYGSPHYHALYAAGMVLMAVLILSNLLFYYIKKRGGGER